MATNPVRVIEASTKAGYLVLAGLVAFVLWRMLRSREETVRTDIVPRAPRAGQGDTEPEEGSEPEGIVAGGLVTGVTAQIIEPPEGGETRRQLFSSKAPVQIEVKNRLQTAQPAQVEIIADYYEQLGSERLGIRTLLDTFMIGPGQVSRFETPMETDNVHTGLYELAQANAIVRVKVNGKLTQTTSFRVW